MSAEGYFRGVLAGDAAHIAPRLRQSDVDELVALDGEVDLLQALERAVSVSSHCWTGCAPDGEPITLLGIAPLSLLGGIGSPWMLGTDRAQDYPRAILLEGYAYIAKMEEQYPHMVNFVDSRNVRSIRWLRRLGFKIHDAEPRGPAGVPFHKFTKGE